MPSASPAPARTIPRQVSSCRARGSRRGHRQCGGGQADPPLGTDDVAELEQAHRHAAGGEELDGPVALKSGRAMGILAPGERHVGHHLGPRIDVDPEEHLEVESRPLALRDELGQAARHPADLLEMPRRGRQVHHRPVLRVGHRDDRRHDAGAVAEPLEDAERALEDRRRFDEEGTDGESPGSGPSNVAARRRPRRAPRSPDRTGPRRRTTRAHERSRSSRSRGGRQPGCGRRRAARRARWPGDRPPRPPSRSTSTAAPPNDSPSGLRRSAWPSSSVARSSVAASPAFGRASPDATGQLGGGVLVVARRAAPTRVGAERRARWPDHASPRRGRPAR